MLGFAFNNEPLVSVKLTTESKIINMIKFFCWFVECVYTSVFLFIIDIALYAYECFRSFKKHIKKIGYIKKHIFLS
jgi:hypothetical protein